MSKVIALVDNEVARYQFLNDFGSIPYSSGLCMIQTPAYTQNIKIFNFEVFGLLTIDTKLNNLIIERDGIVIVISFINQIIIDRIKQIISTNPSTPLLLVFEKNAMFENFQTQKNPFTEEITKHFDVPHRKLVICHNQYENGKNWFYNIIKKTKKTEEIEKTEKTVSLSRTINISEMVTQFENATLPLSIWDHFGRLRIVNYYLTEYGYNKTIDKTGPLCTSWKKYKTSVGHEKLWNYTLTRFWINILHSLHQKHPSLTFTQIYDKYTQIQYGSFFKNYYSEDVLFSQFAKENWVEPNLEKK
jgi:hypothetical protein